MNNKLMIVFVFFVISSCTKPVEIDFPKEQPKLVVNCTFSENDIITLYLTQTLHYQEDNENIIANAKCLLYRNDTLIEQLQYVSNGKYVSKIIPKINNKYKIEISCKGFETVYAESYIPQKTKKIKYTIYPELTFDENGGLGVYYANASIYIENNEKNNHFYELLLKSLPDIITISFYKSDDPILLDVGTLPYQPGILLFSDKLFNTQNKTIFFRHSFPYSFEDTVMLIAENKILTEDYYNYLKSVILQTNNQGNSDDILSVGEPIEIYTNIKNGYGIFSGVNYQYDTLILEGWNNEQN